MTAINDSFLIEASIYKLLKRHFRSKNYYVDLLELFLEVCMPPNNTSGPAKVAYLRVRARVCVHVCARVNGQRVVAAARQNWRM